MTRPCQWCDGHGMFVSDWGPAPVEETCEVCAGSGEWDDDALGIIQPLDPDAPDYEQRVEARYGKDEG